jgi:glutathione synthase/RimK-type ligase-like ATP-grasp enzyme
MGEAPKTTAQAVPPAVQIQQEACRRLGLPTEILDPDFGYLFEVRHAHRTAVLLGGRSPLNDAVAARICEDKHYTELVLRRAGFRVVQSARCLSPHDIRAAVWAGRGGPEPGLRLAELTGYPVIVKPNRLSHGYGVGVANTEAEVRAALHDIWRYDYCALVQPPVPGIDLRLNFLDGEHLLGYSRAPLQIVGDGRRTLRELLVDSDPRFADDEFWSRATTDLIYRARGSECGWDADTVFPRGTKLHFDTPILNLNRWATGKVVQSLPRAWCSFGMAIGHALNLRHFGVDFKVPHLQADPDEATIIEVNSSPLLVQAYRMGYQEEVIAAQARVLQAYFAQ